MYEIDNRKFGTFLAQLRKERNWTQKDLAEKCFVSDKAVSKWERGLSMPDIALLSPLSELLGVTIAELLRGERLGEALEREEVEQLVAGTIELSARERQAEALRKRRGGVYFLCVAAAALEIFWLLTLGFTTEELARDIFLVEFLCLIFGGWLCLFVKETLPAYYDQNKISTYSDGIFRMSLAGIHFNNRNWPHILRAGRLWTLSVPVAFPLLYLAIRRWLPPAVWAQGRLAITLLACLGLFLPLMIAGKRHE